MFALPGLGEAEADCSRNKTRRRVVPGYGEEAQRSAGGNTAGIDNPSQGEYALATFYSLFCKKSAAPKQKPPAPDGVGGFLV